MQFAHQDRTRSVERSPDFSMKFGRIGAAKAGLDFSHVNGVF